MSAEKSKDAELILRPIGYVRTGMRTKFEAPHQPGAKQDQRNVIELLPNRNFDVALRDLAGFSHIWLIWWFHLNKNWKPLVLPPRGPAKRRGVFATRSPHRPNPLGITAVQLIAIEHERLIVGELDLLDGTPILDLKPYLSKIDAFPLATTGWLAEIEHQENAPSCYRLDVSPLAQQQINWLKTEWHVNFFDRAAELLLKDPSPHRTRRISKFGKGFRLGCGPWKIYFCLPSADNILIERIGPGYPETKLIEPGYEKIPDRDAQLQFLKTWTLTGIGSR